MCLMGSNDSIKLLRYLNQDELKKFIEKKKRRLTNSKIYEYSRPNL